MKFTLHSTDQRARRGTIETPHGNIETPVFMPVGTQGTVKGLTQRHLEECGAQIILGNAYHLHVRPGDELIKDLGGLHKFVSWKRPMLTDSGGFQVFSLATLNKVTDEGVSFQSHVDGKQLFLSPKTSIAIQENLGADIIMAFDECPPYGVNKDDARKSMERTLRWAKECQEHQQRDDIALFLIGQGSFYDDLRLECMQRLIELDAPGYAIGGVSVGEPQGEGRRVVDICTPIMPDNKPRYVMGVGKPEELLDYVSMGVDMFDCVMPTRNGRNSSVFTHDGSICIRNAQFIADTNPIDYDCSCYVCQTFSRAYLRHLYKAKEMCAPIYLAYHNIHFYLELMRDIRKAIDEQRFASFKKQWLTRYTQND